jgi:very-short-patch-repair endonuclease
MKSRKEKFRKKTSKGAKLLFGTLFLSIGVGSSITVAFADQDIHGLLSDWFAKQQTTSIETIEKAIMSEKEIQMQRLKEELQIEMNDAEKQLEQFTEEETKQRVNDLKAHTDELIKNISIDQTEEKEAIIIELDEILNESIKKMDDIRTTGDTDNINE